MRFLFLSLLIFTFTLAAEDVRHGVVTGNNVRMRSKPGKPSDVLGELSKGAKVQVVEEKGGWLKIIVPKTLTAWTSNKFIVNGVISGDSVRVRSGPTIAYQMIGKLNKGDKVEVLEIKNKVWAKIKMPSTVNVWVSAAFVKLEVLIVAEQDPKEKEAELAALAEKAKQNAAKKEKMAELQAKLEIEKKATEDARQELQEQQKELARLELEKNAAEIARQEEEKKVKVIKKLLEIEEKKRSKKLVVTITSDSELKIGSQQAAFEDLEKNYKAAGDNTMVFIKADKEADEALIKKVADHFRELKAKVYLEDPSSLLDGSVTKLADEFKDSKMILQKGYITLTVRKPRLLYVGTVPIPEEHLESVLKSYGQNFGNTSAFIQADPGAEADFVDKLMKIVQESGFKLISYPEGFGKEEVITEQPLAFEDDKENALPPGTIRMTGIILNVRKRDRHVVDFALAVKVNGQFYPIAFLKGKQKEMQSFYLKEVEIIGVQKRLDGWTKPILFVEQFKLTNK